MTDNKMKIIIHKDGPFEVIGGIPISQKTISHGPGGVLILKKIKDYKPTDPNRYFLCRCGNSKNAPFCDGTHEKIEFDGRETAGYSKYMDRAQLQSGPDLDLFDDDRCAFARFCHRERAEVWTLTDRSDDPENKREAIEGITVCPSGRLVARDKDGKIIEKKFAPEIEIVEDPLKGCSAGIYVKGGIELIGADGKSYEIQNRMALCRCGQSSRVPFCDATHVSTQFNDGDQE